MARLDFLASLYMGDDGPVIPGDNWEAMLTAAAKKRREGQVAKAGMMVLKNASLEYEGPRSPDDLWNSERFRFTKRVRISTNSVMRTRPIFEDWSAVVEVRYEDSVVDLAQVDDWFRMAGSLIGVGDWRPRFGRFDVKRID